MSKVDSQYQSALQVFHCLQDMGQRNSNPVLEVLGTQTVIQVQQHYPDVPLNFQAERFRAYYHCHPDEFRISGEHGHFHFFIRTDDGWAHAVGLCMDTLGQPIKWFVTNQWVTGGPWLKTQQFPKNMLRDINNNMLWVERWLLAMLELYQDEIVHLLRERDQIVKTNHHEYPSGSFLEDRKIYLIAESAVSLPERLMVMVKIRD